MTVLSACRFPASEVIRACKTWGPDLEFIPEALDPIQLMWAFANKESTHEAPGFFGCSPRFEDAYYSGRYSSSAIMRMLIKQYDKDAAKSYGPWQVLLCNAAKWRPEDFKHIDICAEAFVNFLNNASRVHRPQSIDELGQLYNGGHISVPPNRPLAQVQEYCIHLAEWYKKPIPEVA